MEQLDAANCPDNTPVNFSQPKPKPLAEHEPPVSFIDAVMGGAFWAVKACTQTLPRVLSWCLEANHGPIQVDCVERSAVLIPQDEELAPCVSRWLVSPVPSQKPRIC